MRFHFKSQSQIDSAETLETSEAFDLYPALDKPVGSEKYKARRALRLRDRIDKGHILPLLALGLLLAGLLLAMVSQPAGAAPPIQDQVRVLTEPDSGGSTVEVMAERDALRYASRYCSQPRYPVSQKTLAEGLAQYGEIVCGTGEGQITLSLVSA